MAALFIIGGFVPLDLAIVTRQVVDFAGRDTGLFDIGCYGVAVAIGVLSLLVKRGGREWRFTVIAGAVILLATAISGAVCSNWHAIWSVAVLVLVGLQYRRDTNDFPTRSMQGN